jgi:hypothetical protein
MSRKTLKKRGGTYNRADAIRWLLHALKNTLGYRDVRKLIIEHYYPSIQNPEYINTFDAFIKKYKKEQSDYDIKYNDKIIILHKYLEDIIKLDEYVVFTATNIEEFRAKGKGRDNETHYQTFIVDNKRRQLYAIDPALKSNSELGIYTPQIAINEVMPFFENKGYNTQFVRLKNPAQTVEDDVFCQSWSLYILLQVLHKSKNNDFNKISVDIPKSQLDRYTVLLNFYKDIVTNIPDVNQILNKEYINVLNSAREPGYTKLNILIASDLLLTMTPEEM